MGTKWILLLINIFRIKGRKLPSSEQKENLLTVVLEKNKAISNLLDFFFFQVTIQQCLHLSANCFGVTKCDFPWKQESFHVKHFIHL